MAGKIYGLLGRVLGHSWSVPIHQELGCENYQLYEVEPENLKTFLQQNLIGGLNVTIPYKRDVLPYCDEIDPNAREIGCVNTLVRRPDGRLTGYNTDIDGFHYMTKYAGISLQGKKVLILGSGGASLTAQAAARQDSAREIIVVSRTGGNHYGNITQHSDAEILINTTPVGMYPNNGQSVIDISDFPHCDGVLDVIYNPRKTAFLLQAESLGIPFSDGLPMLVAQAVVAEERFFNRNYPQNEYERILKKLRRDMSNIILIGMPGSGKSTVGKALAELSGREAVDLDQWVIDHAQRSIPDIMAQDGEKTFRRWERQAAEECGKLSGKIIITGGGVVKTPENYASLRQNGRVYFLWRNLDELPTEGRPLSVGTSMEAMWSEREPLYRHFSDVEIDNNDTVAAATKKIWTDYCVNAGK